MGAHHDAFINNLLGLQTQLRNFAMMLTSNRDDADDLVQDTTLKAIDSESKYVDNVNFKGWVFTIMRNLFINNYRHAVRSDIASFDDGYRVPFSLHLAGYRYAEIAERVNLPLGTVKSRIFYARRRLQAMLADYR